MYNYKTTIRDALVDSAGIQGLFGAGGADPTASCWVNMESLRVTAKVPAIIISWGAGETRPGLDADEGRIYLTIECKGTGTTHAYKELGKFRSEILTAIDDMNLSATSTLYHIRKFSEAEGYDWQRKIFWTRLSFNCEFKQNFDRP